MQSKHYDAVNRCVYCGDTEGPFTDEHIIPLSLSGDLLLRAASCGQCQDITSALEAFCARSMFGPFRIRYGLKTRRPKKRPSELAVVRIEPDGRMSKTLVPADGHPALLVMPQLPATPGVLIDSSPSDDLPGASAWAYIGNRNVLQGVAEGTRVGGTPFHPLSILRLVAKIAHCHTVGEVGLEGFKPDLQQLSLGRCAAPGHFIGSVSPAPSGPTDNLHEVFLSTTELHGKTYFVSTVRLFAQFGAPKYDVIVGEQCR